MQTKPVLAFDCATSPASVALRVAGSITKISIPHGEQAAQLVPSIDSLMREHHLDYRDLGCLVTTIGPGSFTGLRIALATLHGLALAHPTPIRLTTASEAVALAIAAHADAPPAFTVALDAGKRECFSQSFTLTSGVPVATTSIATEPADMINTAPLPLFSNLLPADHPHYISGPDAYILAHYAEAIAFRELSDAMPYYIRPADAKIPTPRVPQ